MHCRWAHWATHPPGCPRGAPRGVVTVCRRCPSRSLAHALPRLVCHPMAAVSRVTTGLAWEPSGAHISVQDARKELDDGMKLAGLLARAPIIGVAHQVWWKGLTHCPWGLLRRVHFCRTSARSRVHVLVCLVAHVDGMGVGVGVGGVLDAPPGAGGGPRGNHLRDHRGRSMLGAPPSQLRVQGRVAHLGVLSWGELMPGWSPPQRNNVVDESHYLCPRMHTCTDSAHSAVGSALFLATLGVSNAPLCRLVAPIVVDVEVTGWVDHRLPCHALCRHGAPGCRDGFRCCLRGVRALPPLSDLALAFGPPLPPPSELVPSLRIVMICGRACLAFVSSTRPRTPD